MATAKNTKPLLNLQPQKNTSDLIFDQIRSLIINGELEEGYVFPSETAMCQQYNVGRTTLREAYKALELQGYITRTNKGTYVNSQAEINKNTSFRVIIDESSEDNFVDVRSALESKAAETAAKLATEEDIAKLQDILDQMVQAVKDRRYADVSDLDHAFHNAIAKASHNPLMGSLVSTISDNWKTETTLSAGGNKLKPVTYVNMNKTHQAVLDAIRSHDSTLAAKLMHDHINQVT